MEIVRVENQYIIFSEFSTHIDMQLDIIANYTNIKNINSKTIVWGNKLLLVEN